MANISSKITVVWDLRPCTVQGKKALFHTWGAQPHVVMIGNTSSPIAYTYGIVEYEDGTVDKVNPIDIKFCEGG